MIHESKNSIKTCKENGEYFHLIFFFSSLIKFMRRLVKIRNGNISNVFYFTSTDSLTNVRGKWKFVGEMNGKRMTWRRRRWKWIFFYLTSVSWLLFFSPLIRNAIFNMKHVQLQWASESTYIVFEIYFNQIV